jgi:glycosyltransferase involved in cell wall biosynthesis
MGKVLDVCQLENIIKIIFILPTAQCGGAEKVLITISQSLPDKLFESVILIIDGEGPLLKNKSCNIPILSLNRKRVSHAFLPLIKAIRSIRPNIIVTSIFHLNLSILLLKPFLGKKIKIIIRESNMLSYSLKNSSRAHFFAHLVRWLYPIADYIISLGKEMKKDLICNFGIAENKIVTIPNPVDIMKLKKMALNTENPFLGDKIHLLSVGSLTHQKGFDILINAIEIVVSEIPNVHLTILGDGPLKEDLCQLIANKKLSSHITLAGFKDNPYPYFHHADLFILSSRYEGLPNAVLEAVTFGTPVIAFDNPGCIRDIIADSSTGKLVRPCTSEALAQAILKSCKYENCTGIVALPQEFDLNNITLKYQSLFLS